MPLLLIFVAIPIIEIALFIQVGGWLGLWPTLGIVVLTAVIGIVGASDRSGMAELAQSCKAASESAGKAPSDRLPMVRRFWWQACLLG